MLARLFQINDRLVRAAGSTVKYIRIGIIWHLLRWLLYRCPVLHAMKITSPSLGTDACPRCGKQYS